MALGLKLTGKSAKSGGRNTWTLNEVTWWDERELAGDKRFKKVKMEPNRILYRALLTVDEVRELNDKYKNDYLKVFEGDDLVGDYYQERLEKVERLENKLGSANTRFVAAWIIGWDY